MNEGFPNNPEERGGDTKDPEVIVTAFRGFN